MLMQPVQAAGVASARVAGHEIPRGAIDLDHSIAWKVARFFKEQQIYGEGDPSARVYQVVTGAVRSCKLLSDGRCQITAFHLPGDIFDIYVGF
jgi:CRP/FNR family nitrogen fixation transcriptional regulator